MKIRKYAYLVIPLLCFILAKPVFAATSTVEATSTDGSGLTVGAKANSWTSLNYDEQSQIENANGGLETVYKWHLSQNVYINLQKGKYYNGAIVINVTTTPGVTGIVRTVQSMESVHIDQGFVAYIVRANAFETRIQLVFDNYYTRASTYGIPTLNEEFYLSRTSWSPVAVNFPTTISLTYATSLISADDPDPNGFAGVLSRMIGYSISTAQEFDDIISLLSQIRTQDYSYYSQIVSQLTSVIQNQNYQYQALLDLIDEIDLDFDDVQTVLDLFPSYRSQVLLYWQQLLEMNAAQSSAAEEMGSEYADKDNQSGQLIGGLGSVPMPTFSDGDFNILGNVDTSTKSNFFGLIATITNNSLVTTILLIIVTGMIVGYVLYGKK